MLWRHLLLINRASATYTGIVNSGDRRPRGRKKSEFESEHYRWCSGNANGSTRLRAFLVDVATMWLEDAAHQRNGTRCIHLQKLGAGWTGIMNRLSPEHCTGSLRAMASIIKRASSCVHTAIAFYLTNAVQLAICKCPTLSPFSSSVRLHPRLWSKFSGLPPRRQPKRWTRTAMLMANPNRTSDVLFWGIYEVEGHFSTLHNKTRGENQTPTTRAAAVVGKNEN